MIEIPHDPLRYEGPAHSWALKSALFSFILLVFASAVYAQGLDVVAGESKISFNTGNFVGPLHSGDQFGRSAANVGDLNGDGITDLAVGAFEDSDNGYRRGAVWILFLDSDGTVWSEQKISDSDGGFDGVLANADRFGSALANIGDLDGDGINDLAVGANGGTDGGGTGEGAVWILLLNSDGTVKPGATRIPSPGFPTLCSFRGHDQFAASVTSLGDLNGDGVTDLAVGAIQDDGGGCLRGAVWIFFLNADGTVSSQKKIAEDVDPILAGKLDDGDLFGIAVASLGDLKGDGTTALAVGAHSDDDGGLNRGAVWILFLNSDGTVDSEQKISSTEGGFDLGLEDSDRFGGALSSVGDLDGDGLPELAVGVFDDDDGGFHRGAVWILFLRADGTVRTARKISDTVGGFNGTLADGDRFGVSVANLNDVDADTEVADIAVGANLTDGRRGAVWILFLRVDLDGDDVIDPNDLCPGTTTDPAAGVPSISLGTNRWAEMDGNAQFDTIGNNPTGRMFSIYSTGGCNCAQIIAICGYGEGHFKFGCSISVMDWWTGLYDRAGEAPYQCKED